MNREFTQDVGRYKRGYRPFNWSLATWNSIKPGAPLNQFSAPLDKDAVRPGDQWPAGGAKGK